MVCVVALWLTWNAWLALRLRRHEREYEQWRRGAMPYTTAPEPPTLMYRNGEPTPARRAQQVLTKRLTKWGAGVKRWWNVAGAEDSPGHGQHSRHL